MKGVLALLSGGAIGLLVAHIGFSFLDSKMIGSEEDHLKRIEERANVFVDKLSDEARVVSCRPVDYRGECVIEDKSGLWEIVCDGDKIKKSPTCWLKPNQVRVKA